MCQAWGLRELCYYYPAAFSASVVQGDVGKGSMCLARLYQKNNDKSMNIVYTKNELLEAVIGRLNSWQVNTVPGVMIDLIEGRQNKYVREVLDRYFSGNTSVSLGMRYSVYCTEQIAYDNPQLEKQQNQVLPWLAGYPYNDVNHAICDCWRVKSEPAAAKQPVYSRVPALISAGDIDPDCRPFYNTLIKRYMPNSQLLILHNKGHAHGFAIDGTDYVRLFLEHPYQKLVSQSKNLILNRWISTKLH